MTTTERITLPEIPGLVKFYAEGEPAWERTALDERVGQLIAAVPRHLQDAVDQTLAFVSGYDGFDGMSAELREVFVSLLTSMTAEGDRRGQALVDAGWTEEQGHQWFRESVISELRLHPAVYGEIAAQAGWPDDPAGLDDGALQDASLVLRYRLGDPHVVALVDMMAERRAAQ